MAYGFMSSKSVSFLLRCSVSCKKFFKISQYSVKTTFSVTHHFKQCTCFFKLSEITYQFINTVWLIYYLSTLCRQVPTGK